MNTIYVTNDNQFSFFVVPKNPTRNHFNKVRHALCFLGLRCSSLAVDNVMQS